MTMTESKAIKHVIRLDSTKGLVKLEDKLFNLQDNKDEKIWLHLDYKDEKVVEWLIAQKIPKNTIELLTSPDPKPYCALSSDGALVTIFRCITSNKSSDIDKMISLRCYLTENVLITLNHRPIVKIRELRAALLNNGAGYTTSQLFSDLINEIMVHLHNELDDFIDKVYDFELMLDKGDCDVGDMRNFLLEWRSNSMNFFRYLSPQRELFAIINNVKYGKVFLLQEQMQLQQRRMESIIDGLNNANAKSLNIKEHIENKEKDKFNNVVYFLTALTGIFLPVNLFTSLLGVNVGGIPGAEHPLGFLIVCLIIVVTIIIEIIIFKKLKWF